MFGALREASRALRRRASEAFSSSADSADRARRLEAALLDADFGSSWSRRLREEVFADGVPASLDEAMSRLAEALTRRLLSLEGALTLRPSSLSSSPRVMVLAGANGGGKTSCAGKIAFAASREGLKVSAAACDRYRAGAREQLARWCERVGARCLDDDGAGDSASLAYSAIERSRAAGDDLLLIDTAGRMHARADLMDELGKLLRVSGKAREGAPDDVLLVLDATMGRGALGHAEVFREASSPSGVLMTKTDAGGKGGAILAAAEALGCPIVGVGVGEGIEDLSRFDARAFAEALVGIETSESSSS